tara:strand:- start:3080 stop:5623 length:2544 start_codon:yes stop_codon:yes gene_type:complete
MTESVRSAFDPWVWKMAWRDTRTYRRRLLLFFSCIAMGVGALVAIRSVGQSLEQAVQAQAKTLLGADLELSSQRPFNAETEALIDSLGPRHSREVRFASMVYFPRVDGTRLIQARAIRGDFPFYGTFRTTPEDARRSRFVLGTALVDATLMIQYDVDVGDQLRLGSATFEIVGRVDAVSGESAAFMDAAPRVFIPLEDLETTGLIQHGSIVTYRAAFALPADTDMEALTSFLRDFREKHSVRYETVARRVRRMGRTLDNLYRYLSLSGFAALLLGCVGVASAIHVYIRQKLPTVAVLRCLGARSAQALAVYVVQTLGLGLLGSAMGALVGAGLQGVLPYVLSDLLPVDVETSVDVVAMVQGVGIGTGLSLLFAMFPLVAVRRVSPLLSLRASFEAPRRPDFAQISIAGVTLALVSGLSILQMGGLRNGLGMTVGMVVAFIVLAIAAFALTRAVRRLLPRSWPYVWRQGAANLYRPRNQTHVLVLSLGLGTFLISTLYLMQDTLLNQVARAGGGDRPNVVLFDVQPDQGEAVVEMLSEEMLPVLHRVPVVTMRLAAIEGEPVRRIMEKERRPSTWVLTREYRSTYRSRLFDSETLTEGSWVGYHDPDQGVVPISVGESLLRNLRVEVGDSLTFDVQGVAIECVITSTRQIDWQRIQPNFWVVFPAGVLEMAPQFEVVTSRVPSTEVSALVQRRVVKQFPNISIIDLGLVLKTADEVLSRVGFVIRFMALFSVATGLIVLTAAVISSRYQRIQESVLLRTIGASRKQIHRILLLEYLFLGSLAGLAGSALAIVGAWGLSTTVFDVGFVKPGAEVLAVFAIVALLTVGVGAANSRGIASRPPLEVLRAEV